MEGFMAFYEVSSHVLHTEICTHTHKLTYSSKPFLPDKALFVHPLEIPERIMLNIFRPGLRYTAMSTTIFCKNRKDRWSLHASTADVKRSHACITRRPRPHRRRAAREDYVSVPSCLRVCDVYPVTDIPCLNLNIYGIIIIMIPLI